MPLSATTEVDLKKIATVLALVAPAFLLAPATAGGQQLTQGELMLARLAGQQLQRFCRDTQTCRGSGGTAEWVTCMRGKGWYKTRAGDGYKLCR